MMVILTFVLPDNLDDPKPPSNAVTSRKYELVLVNAKSGSKLEPKLTDRTPKY